MVVAMNRRGVLLTLAVASLALAILGIGAGDAPAPTDHFLLLDLSRSHGMDSAALLEEALTRFPPGEGSSEDRLCLLGFGAGSLVLVPPVKRAGWQNAVLEARVRVDALPEGLREESRVEDALETLWVLADPDRPVSVLLLGDLRYPPGSLQESWRLIRERSGSFVLAGPLLPPDEDVRLELAGPPPQLEVGQLTQVALRIAGSVRSPRVLTVRLGATSARVRMLPDRSASITLPVTPGAGEHDVRAVISDPGGPDAHAPNNWLRLAVLPRRGRTVGVLSHRQAEVAGLLEKDSYRIVALDMHGFGNREPTHALDVLVLADVPLGIQGLDPSGVRAVLEAVNRSGCGLVVTGGARSFAAGGYGPSPLDALLPLSSRPGARRTVVVVLDRSGSMESDRQLLRAVDATLQLSSGLTADDELQVIPFAAAPDRAVPDEPVSPARFQVEAAPELARLEARGPTRIEPALSTALGLLASVEEGRTRIMLLLSDLRDPALDPVASALRTAMKKASVQLIAVLLNPVPETVARGSALGGRLVRAPRITPRLLIEAVDHRGWVEEPKKVRPTDRPAGAGAVELRGWNPVRKGRDASVWLQSGTGEPLGARVRRGAGFVTAFASDVLLEPWSGALLPQLVRSVMPTLELQESWWDGEHLVFRLPGGREVHEVPWLGFAKGRQPARERSAGLWEVLVPAGVFRGGPITVRQAPTAPGARLWPPPRPALEWSRQPLGSMGFDSPQGSRRGQPWRWPFLALALLLLLVLAVSPRHSRVEKSPGGQVSTKA